MEFNCTHTETTVSDEKMYKVFRNLALHPGKFNKPHILARNDWKEWEDLKEAINKEECIICTVIRRITDNSENCAGGRDSGNPVNLNVNGPTVMGVETPCLQKRSDSDDEVSDHVKSPDNIMEGNIENTAVAEEDSHQNNTNKIDDNCDKSDNASVESNCHGKGQQREGSQFGLCKVTLSKILKCQCMDSLDSSDIFRNTLKRILNFWFEKLPVNIYLHSVVRRVRIRRKVMGAPAPVPYQVYEWVFQQPDSIVIIPICRLDDLKLLLQQSYAFSFKRSAGTSAATFSAYVHKDFDADPSLFSIPSITWVNNTFLNVRKFTGDIPIETNVQQSGSSGMNNEANGKSHKKKNKRRNRKRKHKSISDSDNASLEGSAILNVQKSTGDIPIEANDQQSEISGMNE